MIIKILFATGLISSFAWAGGGSVVGNGAGIVENNFQFAYLSLTTTIAECLQQQKCEMTPPEFRTLTEMQKVLETNKSNEKRIQFVSEKDHPDFFNTGEGEIHRIAKTGLTAQEPIYINRDQLYAQNGQPAFDFASILSILAHEVGHQTGELSHAKLDILGSKLKKVILEKVRTHDVEVGVSHERVEVAIINQSFPFRSSEMTISWQGVGSVLVTEEIMKHTNCRLPGATLAGIEIDNGHYTEVSDKLGQRELAVKFAVWAHLTCFDPQTGNFEAETKNISTEITKELKFTVLEVRDL